MQLTVIERLRQAATTADVLTQQKWAIAQLCSPKLRPILVPEALQLTDHVLDEKGLQTPGIYDELASKFMKYSERDRN